MQSQKEIGKSLYEISDEDSQRTSILKLWMAILVVFLHSAVREIHFDGENMTFMFPAWLDYMEFIVEDVIAKIAVPGFFVVSAVFLYRKPFDWQKNMAKKLHSLVIPYFIMNTLWVAFFFVAQHIPAVSIYFSNPKNVVANWNIHDWLNAYFGIYNDGSGPILGPLWFIRDLFVLNVISKGLKWGIDRFPKIAALGLCIMYFFGVDTHIFFLSIPSVFYFCVGYYIVKYNLHFSDLDKFSTPLLAAAYAGIIFANCIVRGTKLMYFVRTIAIIIGLLFFAKCTAQVKPGRWKRVLLWLSQYTMAIYMFHEHTLNILTKVVVRLFPPGAFYLLVQFIGNGTAIIVFCIGVGYYMKTHLPKVYALLTGNR